MLTRDQAAEIIRERPVSESDEWTDEDIRDFLAASLDYAEERARWGLRRRLPSCRPLRAIARCLRRPHLRWAEGNK
ncbi:MAG: hypothetical protein FJ291_27970 [Planctomycetes bacterium]|nr:hypothetical protein [Planctomycetota bacterium]